MCVEQEPHFGAMPEPYHSASSDSDRESKSAAVQILPLSIPGTLLADCAGPSGTKRATGLPAFANVLYARSSGRIGSLRIRLPVMAKMALATAGTIDGVLASPIPPGRSWLCTIWTSTTGISSMRSTS